MRMGKPAFARLHLDHNPASRLERAQRYSGNQVAFATDMSIHPPGALIGCHFHIPNGQIRT